MERVLLATSETQRGPPGARATSPNAGQRDPARLQREHAPPSRLPCRELQLRLASCRQCWALSMPVDFDAGQCRYWSMSILVNVDTGQCRCRSMSTAGQCRAWREAIEVASWQSRGHVWRAAGFALFLPGPPVSHSFGPAHCGKGCLARTCVYHWVSLCPLPLSLAMRHAPSQTRKGVQKRAPDYAPFVWAGWRTSIERAVLPVLIPVLFAYACSTVLILSPNNSPAMPGMPEGFLLLFWVPMVFCIGV